MTPAELPGYLMAIRERVAASVVPVADSMAKTYKEHLTDFTLLESGRTRRSPAPRPRKGGRPRSCPAA